MFSAANLPSRNRRAAWLARLFLSEYFGLGLTVLLMAAFGPFIPGFLSGANFLNLLAYLLPLFVAAIGMTFVMISGGIDLSLTAIIALTSIVGGSWMTNGRFPVMVGIGGMLLVGGAIGAMNGIIITRLRLPAFIVTLASMMFIGGFAVWFTQSKNIDRLPHGFLTIGQTLPITLSITFVVALSAHFILQRTYYGKWLCALGQNHVAAYISGVPVNALTVSAYVVSGLCAGLTSIILTGRLETASPVLGREMLLDIIGATVIGGVSLFGGKGKITWTFFGVLFLATLDNALNLLNLSQFSITIAKGAGILLAATADALRQRFNR